MWYELTRWNAYRSVKHPLMVWYIWVFPVLFTLLIILPTIYFGKVSQAWAAGGIVDSTLPALMLLPGFFFAALAAVATFGSNVLDEHVDENNFTVPMRVDGKTSQQPLTMRIFLCLLFSYLTAISFISIFIGVGNKAFRTLWTTSAKVNGTKWFDVVSQILEIGFLSLFVYLVASILISGAHGLYFLSERVHTP